jgi:DNA-binding CsgD family transcriptional regulator/tetratricopeptide (TPR) repeat protein
VWQRLCRVTAQLPLLVVGTCRPVPRRPEVLRIRREVKARGGVVFTLGGLAAPQVADMAERVVGAVPGAQLAEQLGSASGNPLYVRELLDALTRAAALEVRGGVAELAASGEAGSRELVLLAGAIADRLDFLSGGTREVLGMAALLGPTFPMADLSLVLARSAVDLAETVEEAIAAGVLEGVGTRLRFRHGLLRQALYDEIPKPLRTALHRDAARALMGGGAPVERVAELILAAMEAADGWELEWLATNAASLAQRAPEIAAELFAHGLSHADRSGPGFAVVQDHLAAVAFHLARYEQTEQVCREILAETRDPERYGQIAWLLAYAIGRTNRYTESSAEIAEARADPRTPPVWRARLAAQDAMGMLPAGRYDEAAEQWPRALAEGEQLADPMTIGYALHAKATVLFRQHDMSGALEAIDQALTAMGTEPQLAEMRMRMCFNQVSALRNLDRFEQAADRLRAARTIAEQIGSPILAVHFLISAETAFQHGRWDDALTELDAMSDPSFEGFVRHMQYLPMVMQSIRAMIAAHRGDARSAAQHLGRVTGGAAPGQRPRTANVGYLLMAQAVHEELAGRTEQAAELLVTLLDPEFAVLDERVVLLPQLVRLALEHGDRDTAGRAARACAACAAGGQPMPRAVAAESWSRGLIENDPAPVLAAGDYFRSATRLLELGNALEDAAVLLARADGPAAARDVMGEAIAVYAQLGAIGDTRRAAARLRPLGVRAGVRAAPRRPRTGWDSLTKTERRIAELLIAGGSNPDVAAELQLSRRTVETHVSHILAKLQVHSRLEIADFARQKLTAS